VAGKRTVVKESRREVYASDSTGARSYLDEDKTEDKNKDEGDVGLGD